MNEVTGKSMDELAKMLVTSKQPVAESTPAPAPDETDPVEADGDTEIDDVNSAEQWYDDNVEEDTQLGENAEEGGDDQEEAPDEDSEGDTDDEQTADSGYLDVDDDDLIEVMVDGEKQTRTLRELKEAISGEGAIAKRLQEATEARKEAVASRTAVQEEAERVKASFVMVLSQLDETLHTPATKMPEAELKQTNPARYVQQLDAYNAEAAAIQQSKAALGNAFSQFQGQLDEFTNERKKQEANLLKQAVPEVADAKKRAVFFDTVKAGAARYGFTDNDIAQVMDHRLFLMARDAARYHALTDKTKQGEVLSKAEAKRGPRTLRSGGTRQKSVTQQKQVDRKKAVARAKANPSVDNLAALLRK